MHRIIIGLILLLAPCKVFAVCSSPCVQSASLVHNNGTVVSLAYPSNNTAGNLLVIVAAYGNNGALPTDTRGNSWTNELRIFGAGALITDIWYVCNASAGANTVTLTMPTGNQFYAALQIYEFTGNLTSLCVDHAISNSSTSTVATSSKSISTNGSVSRSTELVLAVFNGNHGSVASITSGAGQSDALMTVTTVSFQSVCLTSTLNATSGLSGVQTMTATSNVNATDWTTEIVAFKLGASAPVASRSKIL